MAKLNDIEIEDLLGEAVALDPTLLDDHMTRLPSLLAYWNERFSAAHKTYLTTKVARQRTEARLYQEEKDARAGGKATVKELEMAVATNAELAEAQDAEIAAEVEKVRLYGVMDALRSKRDMLIQMASTRRTEMQGDPQMRAEARGRREDGEAPF